MSVRRASTYTTVVITLLLMALGASFSPASHATSHVTFTPCPQPPEEIPPTGCTPDSGQALRRTVKLHVTVRSGAATARIQWVQLHIVSDDPAVQAPGQVFTESYPLESAPSQRSYSFDWDTVGLTPYNASYTFRVVAKNHNESPKPPSDRTDLRVDNVPATPRAPRVVSVSTRGVSLAWETAPEPDVTGYVLYRARSDRKEDEPSRNQYEAHLTTTRTEVFDEIDQAGVYWYRLRVIRRSVVTPDSGVQSAMSGRAAEPAVVLKPTPVPPERPIATPAPGSSRGPASGGSIRPMPIARKAPVSSRPIPVPEAPFSTVLDYGEISGGQANDVDYDYDEELDLRQQSAADARRRALPAAIGVFMVSAWAVLTRSRLIA